MNSLAGWTQVAGQLIQNFGAIGYERISDYVLLAPDASQEVKASYPLSEARVDVTEVPGKPGSYRAVVFLKPHFQLEELTVSLRLVANIPAAAA